MASARRSRESSASDRMNQSNNNQEDDPAYDSDHFGRLDALEQLSQDLAGKTYFEKPKVTKKVMVATLKMQNQLLVSCNMNLENVVKRLTKVESLAHATADHAEVLQAAVNTHKDKLATAEFQIQELTEKNKVLEDKVETAEGEIDKLKAQVRGQGQMLQDDIKAMESSMADMRDVSQDFLQRLDDLASEMELTADKVTYRHRVKKLDSQPSGVSVSEGSGEESSLGGLTPPPGSTGPIETDVDGSQYTTMPLTDILNHFEDLLAEQAKIIEVQKNTIKLHGTEIETKANIMVQDDVVRHAEEIEKIKKKVFDQEVVDLMDVRKRQENITESLDSIQRDLINKVDRQAVDEKVESKYAEIIDHLQTALKASEEDEEEFKRSTADLYNTVESLRKGKADRRELADLRSLMLTSTRRDAGKDSASQSQNALAETKAGAPALNKTNRAGTGVKDAEGLVTKEELFVLLEEKVDRGEFDRKLNSAVRSLTQMNRSRVALGSTAPEMETSFQPAAGSTAQMPPPPTTGMWSGLAQALRPMEGGPPPMPQGALAIAKGYTYGRAQTALPGGPGICLACQSPVVNVNSKNLNPGVSLGGGYQVWTDKRPALRTPSPGETLPDLDDRKQGKMIMGTDGNWYQSDKKGKRSSMGSMQSRSLDQIPMSSNNSLGTGRRPNSEGKT